jgi:hypothetical protein
MRTHTPPHYAFIYAICVKQWSCDLQLLSRRCSWENHEVLALVILDIGCVLDLQIHLEMGVCPVGPATHWGSRTNINNELSPAELSPEERRHWLYSISHIVPTHSLQ